MYSQTEILILIHRVANRQLLVVKISPDIKMNPAG